MLDINQDGQKELIILGHDQDNVQIITYDKSNSEIIELLNTHVYGGIRYSKTAKQITYTWFKSFQGAMSYEFYELKNNKLELVKNVGSDDINSYFINTKESSNKVTEDEVRAQFDGFEFLEFLKF